MASRSAIRRGSAKALAISSNWVSVSFDRATEVFFTVLWLSNCLTLSSPSMFLLLLADQRRQQAHQSHDHHDSCQVQRQAMTHHLSQRDVPRPVHDGITRR